MATVLKLLIRYTEYRFPLYTNIVNDSNKKGTARDHKIQMWMSFLQCFLSVNYTDICSRAWAYIASLETEARNIAYCELEETLNYF